MNSCMNSRTNSEKIMDALDLLDEDMALEVAKLRERKKRRPVLWRYGAMAACFALVLLCVLQLGPLMDRRTETDVAVPPKEENAAENTEQTSSAPEESMDALASCPENFPETDESCGDKPGEEVSDGKNEGSESLEGGGMEGVPGDEPFPSLELRIEGYDGDTVLCTVVGNEGCTFYPVGSAVLLRFDIWEGDPVTETTFTRGCVYSVLFNVGYEGDDENMLYAVDAYRLEERR